MIINFCLKQTMKNIIPFLICIGYILPAQADSLNINRKKEDDNSLITMNRNYGPVQRVYCSAKSVGFDIHFNSQSGQLYSYDDFLDKLIPFSIFNEIPFVELIGDYEINRFSTQYKQEINGPVSEIKSDKLYITLSSKSDSRNSIVVSLDLNNLDLRIKAYGDTNKEMIGAIFLIEKMIKCEYIKPETFRFNYSNR